MALFEALDWNALRLCKTLHGEFDFALIAGDRFLIANDAIGVKSLYYGRDEQGRWYFRYHHRVHVGVSFLL
jgi:asparagine synthetase B (glutamine-hydrolysing)